MDGNGLLLSPLSPAPLFTIDDDGNMSTRSISLATSFVSLPGADIFTITSHNDNDDHHSTDGYAYTTNINTIIHPLVATTSIPIHIHANTGVDCAPHVPSVNVATSSLVAPLNIVSTSLSSSTNNNVVNVRKRKAMDNDRTASGAACGKYVAILKHHILISLH
jgi:hypothetical protein